MTIAEAQSYLTEAIVFEFPHGAGGLEHSVVRVAASGACAVVIVVRDPAEAEEDLARSNCDSRLHMT